MAKQKPIDLMHVLYGYAAGIHICFDCCNFLSYKSGGKKIFKCKAYGDTCSSRSDWAKSWEPCGMFNKHVEGQIVSDYTKRNFSKNGKVKVLPEQLEGQTEMEL